MAHPAWRNRRSSGPQSGTEPVRNSAASATPVESGIDLRELLGTLAENYGIILGVAAIFFCCVMAHTLTSSMSFKSSGRLYLGDLETKSRPGGSHAGELDISGGVQGDVGSEIEILKSQSLVSQAILDSGLNVTVRPVGWRPPKFWQWLLAKRDPKLLDVPAKELKVVDTSLSDDSRGSQRFQVDFVSDEEYELRADDQLLGRGKLRTSLKLPQLTILLLPGSLRHPVRGSSYSIMVHPLDVTTDGVMNSLTVLAAKAVGTESAKVLNLEFSDSSPWSAASFLRALMSGYLGERQAWKTEDASAAESFVTDQLLSLRDSLEKTEHKLADYRSNTRVVVLDNEARAMVEQVGQYEAQRVQARLQVQALTDLKKALRAPNPQTEAFLIGEVSDSVLEASSKQLAEARQLENDLRAQFGPDAPQTQQQRGQVERQLEMIRNYVNNRLQRAQDSLESMSGIIAQFENKLKTVPGAELGLAQLARESEVYSKVYSYMLERQQQAAIIKASTVSKNRILDYPHVPYREDSPKLALRLASAPLGLLLGSLLVLAYRMFARTLQSEAEVRSVAGVSPIYGSIPRQDLREDMSPVARLATMLGVSAEGPASSYAEAFRALRTNLYHWGTNEGGQVTLFTSPNPGDGKTTCVLSLAAILAADGKRVLTVDADLRKPSHDDLTQQSQGPGLRSILSGHADWRATVQTVKLPAGSHDSIAAGRMAPSELLSGERMNRFLQEARGMYHFVLLDSPSFPLVADALALAGISDSVISVLRLRHSSRHLSAEHVRRLAAASVTHGVVVNDTSSVASHYPVYHARDRSLLGRLLPARLVRALKRGSSRRHAVARFWVASCLAVIALAGAVMLVQQFSPVERQRRLTPRPAPAAAGSRAQARPVTGAASAAAAAPSSVPSARVVAPAAA
ncbi:MAG: hypothetical protein JWN48_1363, partial [Myxococcaceae bacterium]|nr:hypothetical protein [Myxococcaceae bacterium]